MHGLGRLADDVWDRVLRRDPETVLRLGGQAECLPSGGPLGHWYLRRLRGTRDPKEFHELVLAEGPLPLTVLGEHLGRH